MHWLAASVQSNTGGKDFIESMNPNSLKVMFAFVEPSLAAAKADDKFQFERHGYFVADRVAHAAAKSMFNLAVRFKDSWGKQLTKTLGGNIHVGTYKQPNHWTT